MDAVWAVVPVYIMYLELPSFHMFLLEFLMHTTVLETSKILACALESQRLLAFSKRDKT